jgi:hypothetical protein
MRNINYFFVLALLSAFTSMAQVGIGTTAPQAFLDITSTNSGLLIPRGGLNSLTDTATFTNPQGGGPVVSTLIFNDGSGTPGVGTTGFYYWDGAIWVMLTTKPSSDWTIIGNDGTDANANFIGTSDGVDFVTRTNNIERMRIDTAGAIGINNNNPQEQLHIGGTTGTIRIDALNTVNNTNNNGTDLSPVAADADGNLVLADNPFLNNIIVDATDDDTFLSTPIFIEDTNGDFVSGVLHTETIVLTQTTLVEVIFWTGVSISEFNETPSDDRKPRLFGASVYHVGTGDEIVYSASSYTNGIDHFNEGGTVTNGYFTVNGSGYIELGAGSHSFQLLGYASGGQDGEGVYAEYGNGGSRFQIILHN